MDLGSVVSFLKGIVDFIVGVRRLVWLEWAFGNLGFWVFVIRDFGKDVRDNSDVFCV